MRTSEVSCQVTLLFCFLRIFSRKAWRWSGACRVLDHNRNHSRVDHDVQHYEAYQTRAGTQSQWTWHDTQTQKWESPLARDHSQHMYWNFRREMYASHSRTFGYDFEVVLGTTITFTALCMKICPLKKAHQSSPWRWGFLTFPKRHLVRLAIASRFLLAR